MDTGTVQWLTIGILALFQGATVWAVVATRGKLAQLRASIPPDTSKQLDQLATDVKNHAEKIDDAHKRISGISSGIRQAGDALRTAAARLGAN